MKTPRFWHSHNLLSTALLPASLLYRLGAWIERHTTTPKRAPLPVISVGNITAGGAGKTPTTIALVPMLREMGHTPHILTRGYGGANLTAHRVKNDDDWRIVGDEALLLAATAPTWVGRDRLASAQAAKAAGATILICDDALQHHALHKGISILVIDGPFGLGNARLLPAGPLRETLSTAIRRCDAAILIGDDTQKITSPFTLPTWRARLSPAINTTELTGTTWLAFAGIGRPQKFFDTLTASGLSLVATRCFSDHHPYTTRDIQALETEAHARGATLITTEKDWVKLPPAERIRIRAFPVKLDFEDTETTLQWLKTRLKSNLGS